MAEPPYPMDVEGIGLLAPDESSVATVPYGATGAAPQSAAARRRASVQTCEMLRRTIALDTAPAMLVTLTGALVGWNEACRRIAPLVADGAQLSSCLVVLEADTAKELSALPDRDQPEGAWHAIPRGTQSRGARYACSWSIVAPAESADRAIALLRLRRLAARSGSAHRARPPGPTGKRVTTPARPVPADPAGNSVPIGSPLDVVNVGIAAIGLDGSFIGVNRRLCTMLHSTAGELRSRKLVDVALPEAAVVISGMEQRLLTGVQAEETQRVALRAGDGETVWVDLTFAMRRSTSGDPASFLATFVDVTRKTQILDELALTSQQLGAILENKAIGIVLTSRSGIWLKVNERFCQIIGYEKSELEGQDYRMFTHPEDLNRNTTVRSRAFEGGVEQITAEKRWIRKNGEAFWSRITLSIYRPPDGGEPYSIAFIRDIEDEKRAEHIRDVLIGELNHRVKNTLAVVQGLVQQTLRTQPEPTAAAAAIESRLQGLSRAHDLLNDSAWTSVKWGALVERVLEGSFGGYRPRLDVQICDVEFGAQQAVMLALILHELATNAVKHGSLSNDLGRVGLDCSERDVDGKRWVEMQWIERGGPPVAPTERHGFGRSLLERGAAFSLGGKAALEVPCEGLRYRLEFPLRTAAVMDVRRAHR